MCVERERERHCKKLPTLSEVLLLTLSLFLGQDFEAWTMVSSTKAEE